MANPWRSTFFAPGEGGPRRRRGSDGFRLIAAALTVLAAVAAIRYSAHFDRILARFLHPPPSGVEWLVVWVYDLGAYGLSALLVILFVLTRRRDALKDVASSVLASVIVGVILVFTLGADAGRPANGAFAAFDQSFPLFRITIFTAAVTAAFPHLARTIQRLVEGLVVLVAVAAVVTAHGLPLNVLGSIAIGWGATALVHLWLGSPLGLPSSTDVQTLLHLLGVPAGNVRPAPYQIWGVARFLADEKAADYGNGHLGVSVYGRDAIDARFLAKLGRFIFYRDSGPTLSVTRLQEVEREAFLSMWAARLGVNAPDIVSAGAAGESRDALLAYRLPPGAPLADLDPDGATERLADQLLGQVLVMRESGFAHGALSSRSIYFEPISEAVALTDFRNAIVAANPERLDRDLASALAVLALLIGVDRAAASADRCLDVGTAKTALAHLRTAGLDPVLGRELRRRSALLEELRTQIAEAKSIELPKLVEPRRISWSNLLLLVGSLVGGWALIGTLLNVSKSFDTIIGANWGWVIGALIIAHLTFVAEAVEDLGGIPGELPLGPLIALEVANTFTALAGGSVATFGTRVRFFQQQGYDGSVAISSGVAVAAANWIVKGALFLISLPLAWGTLHAVVTPEAGQSARIVWIILAAVVALGVATGLIAAIPRLRRVAIERVRPRVARLWSDLHRAVSQPRKLLQLLGGSLCAELMTALVLSASIRAFGDHLGLPTVIVVISLSALVGGISPVPGGLGVVEAGLILGLTSAGLSEADATAAVFIQRLFTSYLPPIWGWFTLLWMRRREYI